MGLDEAAKKVKSLPATVTAAMQIKTLHHHKKHRHGDNSALQQQEEAKKKSIEAALDKAKLTLSNMMEETKEEMDKAILTCTEFDSQTVSTLDINKGYRAQLAAQVAEAKGFIAQAKMMISEATTELDSLKTISEEHAQQCFITITSSQEVMFSTFILTERSLSRIARPSCFAVMVIKHCWACSSEIVLSESNSVVASEIIIFACAMNPLASAT